MDPLNQENYISITVFLVIELESQLNVHISNLLVCPYEVLTAKQVFHKTKVVKCLRIAFSQDSFW